VVLDVFIGSFACNYNGRSHALRRIAVRRAISSFDISLCFLEVERLVNASPEGLRPFRFDGVRSVYHLINRLVSRVRWKPPLLPRSKKAEYFASA